MRLILYMLVRYDSQAIDFDVALVRLKTTQESILRPLCLPTISFDSGAFCVIAGKLKK